MLRIKRLRKMPGGFSAVFYILGYMLLKRDVLATIERKGDFKAKETDDSAQIMSKFEFNADIFKYIKTEVIWYTNFKECCIIKQYYNN